MRRLLALLAVLLSAPAAAAAQAPVSLPAVGNELPRALAFFSDGRGAVVTQTSEDDATQAVITVPAGRRTTFVHTTILASVNRDGGGVDLLVRRGGDPTRRAQLTLRRVLPDGRILDLWSHDSRASVGALARRGQRTVAIWVEGSKLLTNSRPDGGLPTPARTVALGLHDVTDLALGIDARGRVTVAAMTPRGLVVAALTLRGRVLRSQTYRAARGLLDMAVTFAGRVGVLIEDTGIEGDTGECVSDGQGRHIRAVVREPLAARFGALQTIESPPLDCGGGALLRALPKDGLTAIYQGGSYDHPPLLARIATAARGHRFGAPSTILPDARADTAVVTNGGELVVGLLRKTIQPEVFSGALTVLHAPDSFADVDPGPVFAPLLALDALGGDVLAWRTATALKVAP
jgi:hypothetical protein